MRIINIAYLCLLVAHLNIAVTTDLKMVARAFKKVDLTNARTSARMKSLGPIISERFNIELRDWQAHAIDSLLSGNDIGLSAGSGKSLVFQALALAHPETIMLILAPLNALMANQVLSECNEPEPV